MADATVQKARITAGQVSALFWFGCAIGLAIAVGLAACSQLIASLYHEPKLMPIALGCALTFALSGPAGQHLSLLRRTLQYAAIAKLQFIAVVLSVAVAVVIAAIGGGYWSLVARPVCNAAFVTAGAWLACRWRPGVPIFDDELKSMVRFGSHVVGFSVIYSMARAADRMVLGLFYSPIEVGYYQNGVVLYDNSIFSVLGQLHNIGSAALSKLQSDRIALTQKYEAALSVLSFFLMPTAAILSLTARDVVVILLGDRWRPAGAVLAIVALRGIFQAIEGSQGWLHLSLGRADRWKNWGIVTGLVQVVAVLCGSPFGIEGVAVATVAVSAVLALPSISYAGYPAGIGASVVVRATGRQLIGSVICLVVGCAFQLTALQHVSSLSRALALTCLAVGTYLLVVVGLFRLYGPLEVAARHVRQQFPSLAKIDVGNLGIPGFRRGCSSKTSPEQS
jgi:PST family polysaccharide transporter